MRGRVVCPVAFHPVPVIHGRAPIYWYITLEERANALSLHLGRDSHASIIEPCLGKIDVQDQVGVHAPGGYFWWIAHQERHAKGFLVHEPLVVPAMVSEEKALVTGIHDDGVVQDAKVFEARQQSPDVIIDGSDHAQVILQISLIEPVLALLERVEPDDFSRRFLSQWIVGFELVRIEIAWIRNVEALVQARADVRDHLDIAGIEITVDAHAGILLCLRRRIIIVERGWSREVNILEHRRVLLVHEPRSMWRLVMTHEKERFLLVTLFEPIHREIRDQVGHVAGFLHGISTRRRTTIIFEKHGIEVITLPGEHLPRVKTGRAMVGSQAKMPLAKNCRLITIRLQILGNGRATIVHGQEGFHAVEWMVVVLPREYHGPARRANGIRAKTILEEHALVGDAIDVRGLVDLLPLVSTPGIARNRVKRVVIAHNV